jgi:hypothetical protein
MESPYGEKQLHPSMGAKVAELAQRVVIKGQALGKSSKVINSQGSFFSALQFNDH